MKKMSAAFTLVMALLVINFTTNAEAFAPKPPTGPLCPGGQLPGCVGEYSLNDMGFFDANGVWNWHPDFVSTVDPWLSHAITYEIGMDWKTYMKPTVTSSLPKVTSGNFQRRHYAPGRDPEMRFVFQASREVKFPKLMLGPCYKGGHPWEPPAMVNTSCSDPDAHGANIYWGKGTDGPISNIQGVAYTMNDVASVTWNGIDGTPKMTDKQTFQVVSYDLVKRFWNSLSPNWQTPIDLHFTWPIPTDLALEQEAKFEIKIKSLTTPLITKSAIKSLSDMPAIPGTITGTEYNILKEKDKKSGKITIKAEEVEVTRNNITVREINDPPIGTPIGKALVIQWPEPDIALFGGADMGVNTYYILQVMVGAFPATVDIYGTTEVFLVYDVPAQMGTCVVEAPSYESLLIKMNEKGGFTKDDLRVFVRYTEEYNNTGGLKFQNRGISSYVPINEN